MSLGALWGGLELGFSSFQGNFSLVLDAHCEHKHHVPSICLTSLAVPLLCVFSTFLKLFYSWLTLSHRLPSTKLHAGGGDGCHHSGTAITLQPSYPGKFWVSLHGFHDKAIGSAVGLGLCVWAGRDPQCHHGAELQQNRAVRGAGAGEPLCPL